jgi:DNA-binding helix-hairpin-helix protein with protein kinase domain
MPDVSTLQAGDTARLKSSDEAVSVGDLLAEGGQGAVYRATLSGHAFAVKWYAPFRNPWMAEQIATLNRLVERGKPRHDAFIWPIDMVECQGRSGFGYLMPLMEPRFKSFARLLRSPELPGFWTLIQIGINLVDAFAALHTNGLCYRDISFGNIYVDPESGDVAVIDNDNVGPNGGESVVRGTPQFMAPEVIRAEKAPSIETDLYSLAVFLFFLFFFGHPLEGEAVEASYSWDDDKRLSEQAILLKHYGREPIFVFDPADHTNRPLPDAPVRKWWGIYPRFFRNLFVKSFTTGLTDPSLTGRLAEGIWRRGLQRLADCVWLCGNCGASIFFDPDDAGHGCWSCGTIPPPPMLLTTPGHILVLNTGAVLTGRHLKWPAMADRVLAVVESDPRYPGTLLRNRTDEVWTVRPVGEETKKVKPGHRLMARPMTIELAGKQAVVLRVGQGGETR